MIKLLPCLVALSAFASTTRAVETINVDQANPPFMYADSGKPAGVYPALIDAAFRHMGLSTVLKAVPWARALQEIDHGNAGIGGIYKNTEREGKYDYSEPLFVEKLSVYFNKSKPLVFTRLEDLDGKRVGVIRGWSYGNDFDRARLAKRFRIEEVLSDEQNFGKLERGRLDAIIAVAEAGDALMRKHPYTQASPFPLALNPTYLAFAKSTNRGELLQRFNEALRKMKASGELNNIVAEAFSRYQAR